MPRIPALSLSPTDLDVVLRDTIADFVHPAPGEPRVSPVRVALAAVSIDRDPMFAASVIYDLSQACAIVACDAREGFEWRAHLLANVDDHYTQAVWHIVADQDLDDIVADLDWLEAQLKARYASVKLITAKQRSLPAFLPIPDPSPDWIEADGAPPLADPFVPKGWTYADWYAQQEVDIYAPCELDDDGFSASILNADDGSCPPF